MHELDDLYNSGMIIDARFYNYYRFHNHRSHNLEMHRHDSILAITQGRQGAAENHISKKNLLAHRLTCNSLWQEKRRNRDVSRLNTIVFYYSSKHNKSLLLNNTAKYSLMQKITHVNVKTAFCCANI